MYFYENHKTLLFCFQKARVAVDRIADDSYLQGGTKEQCNQSYNAKINLLTLLGFTILIKKSVLESAQSIGFLGFVIGSTAVSVKIDTFRSNLQARITDLASAIDTLTSLFRAMPFGKLYCRNLEKEKILALKLIKGIIMLMNNKLRKLGKEATNELQWWLRHIPLANRSITLPEVDFIISTDASGQGWGATDRIRIYLG